MSKLNLGPDDPSKPLLALIIDRLSSASPPKAAGSLQGEKYQPGQDKVPTVTSGKITKDKESIEASLNEIKKPEEKSKELSQPAREAPSLNQHSHSGFGGQKESAKDSAKDIFSRDSDKQLNKAPSSIDAKKEIPKMMAAKKESDIAPLSAPKDEKSKRNEKSEDSLPSKRFQHVVPEDAMKKKPESASRPHALDERDDGIIMC